MMEMERERKYTEKELQRLSQAKAEVERIERQFERLFGPSPSSEMGSHMYGAFETLSKELGYVVLTDDFSFQEALAAFEDEELEDMYYVLDTMKHYARDAKGNGHPVLLSVEDVKSYLDDHHVPF